MAYVRSRSPKMCRGRMSDGSANPVDMHIGRQLRQRRLVLNLSQEKLAEKLGLTFQQIQKYEHGVNRLSGSRIWDMCQVLGVEPNYFFMGMNNEISDNSPRMLRYNGKGEIEPTFFLDEDPLFRAETLELVTAYYRLRPQLRELFAETIKQVVRTV